MPSINVSAPQPKKRRGHIHTRFIDKNINCLTVVIVMRCQNPCRIREETKHAEFALILHKFFTAFIQYSWIMLALTNLSLYPAWSVFPLWKQQLVSQFNFSEDDFKISTWHVAFSPCSFSVPLYGTRVAAFVSLSALLHVIKILEENSRRNIHATPGHSLSQSLSLSRVTLLGVNMRVCARAQKWQKKNNIIGEMYAVIIGIQKMIIHIKQGA